MRADGCAVIAPFKSKNCHFHINACAHKSLQKNIADEVNILDGVDIKP